MTKILLVEDNEMNRDMLVRRLVRRGFEVTIALDGAESIEMVHRDSPDLILMDMSLPVMDGYQATRILKENPETRSIPVLGLSAHAMTGDAERAMDAGCDDYDTKPVDMKRLLGKIEVLLEGAASQGGGPARPDEGVVAAPQPSTPPVPPPPPRPAEAAPVPPAPPDTPAKTVLLPPLPLPAARPPSPASDAAADEDEPAAERETFSTVPLEPPSESEDRAQDEAEEPRESEIHPTVVLPADWKQQEADLDNSGRPGDKLEPERSRDNAGQQGDRQERGRRQRDDQG